MKKITTAIKIIAALLQAIIIMNLSSCKKDLNTEDIIVYTPTGSIGSNSLNGGAVVTLRNKVLSSSYIGFPALLTKAYTSDVNINAAIDTSQVSIYNKINKTHVGNLSRVKKAVLAHTMPNMIMALRPITNTLGKPFSS